MADSLGDALDLVLCSEQNRVAFATLNQICLNIVANPAEAKFRRLKLSNPALTAKIFSVPGGRDVLTALGFVLEESAAGEAALVLAEGQALPEAGVARVMEMLDAVGGPPPPPQPAPQPAAPPSPAPSGSFFSGMGLSPAEREKRAKEGQERARLEAEEKKRLVEQAAANQKEREANEALMGGVKASIAKPLGTGVQVKLCVCLRPWGVRTPPPMRTLTHVPLALPSHLFPSVNRHRRARAAAAEVREEECPRSSSYPVFSPLNPFPGKAWHDATGGATDCARCPCS